MWLLLERVYSKLQAADKAGYEATHEHAREISAHIGWDVSDVLAVSGEVGTIEIRGVITNDPDPFAAIFADGNTTYRAIIEAIAVAEADENVKDIVLNINSPGGSFNGMLEAMEAIRHATKPTRAEVGEVAASAAFGLAASADEIVALSKSSQFGSVGVVMDFRISEGTVSITNSGSPDKRPDPATPEGRATIQGELDAAFELFAEAIAESRDIEASEVAEKFGKGGTFFAEKALTMGMVDSVKKSSQNTSNSDTPVKSVKDIIIEPNNDQGVPMDLATLKEKHPELVASLQAEGKSGASTDAVSVERERVKAHMDMAADSGDTKFALECIADGTEITPAVAAMHVMAAGKKAAIESRQGDSLEDLANNDDGTDGGDDAKDKTASDNIMANAAARLNVEV
jgi:ClpP class serine protease